MTYGYETQLALRVARQPPTASDSLAASQRRKVAFCGKSERLTQPMSVAPRREANERSSSLAKSSQTSGSVHLIPDL